MMELKIGLVCIGQDGERNDLAEQFRAEAAAELAKRNVTVVNAEDGYTLTGRDVREQTEKSVARGADAVIYLIGVWCLASHVVDAVRELKVPFAVWGVPEPASFSSVGANVVHGALGEMDIAHKLLYGMPNDARVYDDLIAFAKAAALKTKLARLRIGMIGGRAISAYPTAMDPNLIKKVFGAEVEHIDQLVLLEKARRVPMETCDAKIAEMRGKYHSVDVPEDMLRRAAQMTVDKKGQLNLSYLGGILARWHDEGIDTPEKIPEKPVKKRGAAATDPEQSSLDLGALDEQMQRYTPVIRK